MKKCNECHSVNNSNAKYCRCCGVVLEKNILELYPKMKLVPTNFYDWRKPKVGMLLKMFLMWIIILYCSMAIYDIFSYYNYDQNGYNSIKYTYEGFYIDTCETSTSDIFNFSSSGHGQVYLIGGKWYSDYDYNLIDEQKDKYVVIPVGNVCDPRIESAKKSLENYRHIRKKSIMFGIQHVLILLFLQYLFCGYIPLSKKNVELKVIADYVQKYSYWGIFRKRKTPKFILFIKDNKFGILDVAHYKVYLPAQYDYLEWREKKKYLNATLNGRKFIIDINGNELK